jgi:hypothetical protein
MKMEGTASAVPSDFAAGSLNPAEPRAHVRSVSASSCTEKENPPSCRQLEQGFSFALLHKEIRGV